jgi:hypothetical protein
MVAGPTCCGKTWFINNLKSEKLIDIREKIQMGDIKSWVYQDAYYLDSAKLKEILDSSISKILLHWTIPLPRLKIFLRNIVLLGAYDKKARIQILHSANNLTILTLYANPTTLIQRVELRRNNIIKELDQRESFFLKKMIKMSNINKVKKIYSDRKHFLHLYNRWFNFVREDLKPQMHYLVDVNGEPTLKTVDKWNDIVKNWDYE